MHRSKIIHLGRKCRNVSGKKNVLQKSFYSGKQIEERCLKKEITRREKLSVPTR